MRPKRSAKQIVFPCCAIVASVAGSNLWAAQQPKVEPRTISKLKALDKALDLNSKIGRDCILHHSPAQTDYVEGKLVGVSDKWIVISKTYGKESIDYWFPITSVHYISFTNLVKPTAK